jgi:hypothetical protein
MCWVLGGSVKAECHGASWNGVSWHGGSGPLWKCQESSYERVLMATECLKSLMCMKLTLKESMFFLPQPFLVYKTISVVKGVDFSKDI